jgi:hypothetical protein
MIEVMSPETTNPLLQEYNLCSHFKWDPRVFEDHIVEIPSFKDFLKWIFGKPLKVNINKGLEATKLDKFIAILSEERIEQMEEIEKQKNEIKLKQMLGGRG